MRSSRILKAWYCMYDKRTCQKVALTDVKVASYRSRVRSHLQNGEDLRYIDGIYCSCLRVAHKTADLGNSHDK